MPALNPFGAESTEGGVLTVEVTDRRQSEVGVIRSERVTVRLSGGEQVAIERQFASRTTRSECTSSPVTACW